MPYALCLIYSQVSTVTFDAVKFKSIWDDYGVFGVKPDNTDPTSMFYPHFPPLNNAPSNWSTVDLDEPYSRDFPVSPWKTEYGGLSVTASINCVKNIIVNPHLILNLIWIELYLLALSIFMQDNDRVQEK